MNCVALRLDGWQHVRVLVEAAGPEHVGKYYIINNRLALIDLGEIGLIDVP